MLDVFPFGVFLAIFGTILVPHPITLSIWQIDKILLVDYGHMITSTMFVDHNLGLISCFGVVIAFAVCKALSNWQADLVFLLLLLLL